MESEIKKILAREVLDSRGYPTVEAEVHLNNGEFGRASVPSGASTGSKEAIEVRDNDPQRYQGKGVLGAVRNIIEIIQPKLLTRNVLHQSEIDQLMIEIDGTENKSNLGANAILAVSLASAKAAAKFKKQTLYNYLGGRFANTLPLPLLNVINGGAHANNGLDIQEFMLVPHGYDSFREALGAAAQVFHNLKQILNEKGLSTNVGDEGGFAPNLSSTEETLEILLSSIEKSGYEPSNQISIALDVAATEFHKENQYVFSKSSNQPKTTEEMVQWYEELISKFPIVSIEDPLSEEDWDGWSQLTQKIGSKTQIVGDDLFVTNSKYLEKGTQSGAANAILIKLNQIGTVTETLETLEMAQDQEWGTIISHRSGETEDTFISDFAVATGAEQIKTGSLSRSDRLAKYNQLLRIEESLGEKAMFAGPAPLKLSQ